MTKREELKCFYSCHQHKTSKIFKFSGTAVSLLVLDKHILAPSPHPKNTVARGFMADISRVRERKKKTPSFLIQS